MRLAKLLIPFLALAACTPGSSDATTTGAAAGSTVTPRGEVIEPVRVFDGDSFVAARSDGSETEIRLLGINAPEGDECFGDAARAALEEWLESGTITLVTDEDTTDQFNRELRYVYVDGRNVNLEMTQAGDAIALQSGHSLEADFVDAAEAAATTGLGLWAPDACGPSPPPLSVTIVDYVFDPRGRDVDDLNGEWVAIANAGATTVDMTDWVLRDESTQNRFRFPVGFSLMPETEVIVRSGCGQATANELFWCSEEPVWSNGGDTVLLLQNDGAVVARESYLGNF